MKICTDEINDNNSIDYPKDLFIEDNIDNNNFNIWISNTRNYD